MLWLPLLRIFSSWFLFEESFLEGRNLNFGLPLRPVRCISDFLLSTGTGSVRLATFLARSVFQFRSRLLVTERVRIASEPMPAGKNYLNCPIQHNMAELRQSFLADRSCDMSTPRKSFFRRRLYLKIRFLKAET